MADNPNAGASGASDLMRTGVTGLDEILGGGFQQGNSVLVQGTPGAGKSALGLQIIANGALKFDEPGIILSFEQFPEQLYRDALSFGWDFREMEKRGLLRIIFARRDDLHSSFAERESAALTLITDGTIDLGAKRVLVDPVNTFWQLPLPAEEQRKVFIEFVMKLKGLRLTPILTSDIDTRGGGPAHEEFAVDTIVRLDHIGSAFPGGARQRTIEIVKARGQGFTEGRHPFRIFDTGVSVTPFIHVAPPENGASDQAADRCSTGIADLDALVHGGVLRGSSTMIAGMSGTGKSIIAAHFLAAGLGRGEKCVLVTLNERATQLVRNMDQRGTGFRDAARSGDLTIVRCEAPSVQLIELYYQLKDLLESQGATRVVIDGLRDMLLCSSSERESAYYLSLLDGLFCRHHVTSMLTWRVDDVAGLSSLASIPHTALMDNIFYLGLVELESKLRKVIAIFKTRGESTDNALRELVITPSGVNVSSLFTGISGILLGSASGSLSETGREIVGPLMHIRDFVNNADIRTPEQAQFVSENIRQEFNILAQKLTEHFDLEKPHGTP